METIQDVVFLHLFVLFLLCDIGIVAAVAIELADRHDEKKTNRIVTRAFEDGI